MDGSVSLSHSERARIQVSQNFGNRAANEAHTHSELFEQLLSLNFTVEPLPKELPEPAEPVSTQSEDPICECEDRADDRKEEEEVDTLAAPHSFESLIPVANAEKQNPIEPDRHEAIDGEPSKPVPEAKLCDLPKPAGEAIEPIVSAAPLRGDEQVKTESAETIVAAEATSETEESTSAIVAANSEADESIRRQRKEQSTTVTTAERSTPVEPIAAPTLKAEEGRQPEEPQAVQKETAFQEAIPENSHQADDERGGDRRADHRHKWFEQDASSVRASDSELTQSDTRPTLQQEAPALAVASSDAQSPSALTPEMPPATSELPSAPTAAATPIAVPISVMPGVNSSVVTSSQSAATTTETQSLGPTAPTRNIGSQAVKGEAKDKTEASEMTQQERVRVIQRIARSFNRISAEGGTINLRLHPEHLGSVSVQVKLEGRSMAARLTTETTAARDAIMADLPALRQRLADQGFDVTKFQVDVAGNGADATFAQTNGESQSRQYEDRSGRSQTDYRRLAANREARMAFARPVPFTATATNLTGAGIDLQV